MRFKIVHGSESGHCCFEYSIVDTQQSITILGQEHFALVCECFYEQEAILVCEALNARFPH